MLTSVGSFIAHPGNNKATSIFNYEYGHFGQQVKRNVSHTATKHREVQNFSYMRIDSSFDGKYCIASNFSTC
jgi:hypothetical protein